MKFEGANETKIFRNVTVVGAFWAGVALLVTSANAQPSVYDSKTPVQTVTTSSGMSPSTVPQANVDVKSTGTGVEGSNEGNANTGGVQVQNVTVQAQSDSGASASAENTNSAMQSVDAINKNRTDIEQTHNALLLQKLELERLKAEQQRMAAINSFNANSEGPCGTAPCVPTTLPAPMPAPVLEQKPLIENNNVIIQQQGPTAVLEVEETPSETPSADAMKIGISPIIGYRWFSKNSYYRVSNQFVAGAGVTTSITPWFSAEGSFIYGRDSISERDAFINSDTTRDSYEFSVGGRLSPQLNGVIHPYVSLGIGYLRQHYNDLDGFLYGTTDETTSAFEVNTGAGVDFTVAKSLMLGIRGDYQFVSSSENSDWETFYGDNSNRYRIGATAVWTF